MNSTRSMGVRVRIYEHAASNHAVAIWCDLMHLHVCYCVAQGGLEFTGTLLVILVPFLLINVDDNDSYQ